MSQDFNFVRLDENGVYRIGKTQVMFDSVLAAFHQGHSAESIMQQYPALMLADVYGSIAYYLTHSGEIESYLSRQAAVWEQWRERSEQQPSPVAERLRGLRKNGGSEGK